MFNNFIKDAQYALKFGKSRPKPWLTNTQAKELNKEIEISDNEQIECVSEDKNTKVISDFDGLTKSSSYRYAQPTTGESSGLSKIAVSDLALRREMVHNQPAVSLKLTTPFDNQDGIIDLDSSDDEVNQVATS